MKFLKKLLATFVVIFILTTIILWVLAKSIKPEIIKDYISSQLTSLTAQPSQVEGDISWQLFPRPGVKITGVQIGNESSQTNYSVKIDNLLFNLKITPLLRGKLVFSELAVNGFKVNINPNAERQVKPKKSTPADKHSTQNSLAKQFAIERFLLSQGQVTLIQDNNKLTLSNLQVGADQFNLQKETFPLQLKSNFILTSANKAVAKASVSFKGSLALSASLFNDPLTVLQQTPLNGQLSLQNLRIKQFKVNKISANVKTKAGSLLLNPLTLNLYNGESVGDLSYEFANMKFDLNQTATNLDGSKLLYDLTRKNFKGTADFSLHAQASMQNTDWQNTVTGKGNLTIKDGIVESIDLDKFIDETSNLINGLISGNKENINRTLQPGQFENPDFFKGNTNFRLLTLQYALQEGKLQSDSLVLQTDRLQLKGEGTLNLRDNLLDGHLLAKVSLTNPSVDKIQQLLGGSFPVLIKGNLVTPIILPDLKVINPLLTRFWLKETLTKPVKQIHKQLKSLLTAQ
ncbi:MULTISPECIES: AsmA family protein [unclassified Legionella]|uniref:AsmA family protein n=1 Tax=unclassified Legionella TaxID=2622702 RepID=UPI0010562C54|nr:MULTISPECIES: AsmA family protein [unclassified Legionella]MDI9819469.1 AsmA family protein [Legionella sp. PL877]